MDTCVFLLSIVLLVGGPTAADVDVSGPDLIRVDDNTIVSYFCNYTGASPVKTVTYKWGDSCTPDREVYCYVIAYPRSAGSFIITCTVDSEGGTETASKAVLVTFEGMATVLSFKGNGYDDLRIPETDRFQSVSLICTARGNPIPVIAVYKLPYGYATGGGVPLTKVTESSNELEYVIEKEYSVEPPGCDSVRTDWYRCDAINAKGRNYTFFRLILVCPDEPVEVEQKGQASDLRPLESMDTRSSQWDPKTAPTIGIGVTICVVAIGVGIVTLVEHRRDKQRNKLQEPVASNACMPVTAQGP